MSEPDVWVVRATRGGLDRAGESVVAAPPGAGLGSHVVVTPVVSDGHPQERIGAVARVVEDPSVAPGELGVDEVLRWSVGVVTRDRAEAQGLELAHRVRVERIEPAVMRAHRWGAQLRRVLLGFRRQNHVYLRVKKSGLYTAERNVALVDSLTLDLLGIAPGGIAWLEAGTSGHRRVKAERMKMLLRPDALAEERAALAGDNASSTSARDSASAAPAPGDWGSTYPNPRRLLGLPYDIPEVYIDAATRERLGLDRTELAVVRARASVTALAADEARGLFLLFAITLTGLRFADALGAVSFAVVAIGAALVSMYRIRSKVSLPPPRSARAWRR